MSSENVNRIMTLNEYMQLPYRTSVYLDHWDGEPCYMAYNDELPGCKAQGATWEEAVASLNEARRDLIAILLEDGMPVPLPEALNISPPSWLLVSGTDFVPHGQQDKSQLVASH